MALFDFPAGVYRAECGCHVEFREQADGRGQFTLVKAAHGGTLATHFPQDVGGTVRVRVLPSVRILGPILPTPPNLET